MDKTRQAPALKTFCVWADCNRRVYQDVDARTPEQAYRIAKHNPDGWEFCIEHESDGYRLSNEVQDTETGEFIAVRPGRAGTDMGAEDSAERKTDRSGRDLDPLEVLQAISNDCEAWLDESMDMPPADLLLAIKSAADTAVARAKSR